jgi:uncharacterized membrane protein
LHRRRGVLLSKLVLDTFLIRLLYKGELRMRCIMMVVFAGMACSIASAQATFSEIIAPAGHAVTQAAAVSADGTTVTGTVQAPSGWRAFRKTASSFDVLGLVSGALSSSGSSVNADGTVVGGTTTLDTDFNWYRGGISVNGGTLNSTTPTSLYIQAISDDGNIVGMVTGSVSFDDYFGTVLERSTGRTGSVGWPASGGYTGSDQMWINDLSADATLAVGYIKNMMGSKYDPIVWHFNYAGSSITSAPEVMPIPAGWNAGQLNGVSSDGVYAVGVSYGVTQAHTRAHRWDVDGGTYVSLGTLAGYTNSTATSVDGDGDCVVGYGANTSISEGRAFLWSPSTGMRPLHDVLTLKGADLTGWTLSRATSVSADGRTIVGVGVNPSNQTRGWIATIPNSALCPADFDDSGFVDIEDFNAFVAAFELGEQDADFDGSGFVDTEDFDAFVEAFEVGC